MGAMGAAPAVAAAAAAEAEDAPAVERNATSDITDWTTQTEDKTTQKLAVKDVVACESVHETK